MDILKNCKVDMKPYVWRLRAYVSRSEESYNCWDFNICCAALEVTIEKSISFRKRLKQHVTRTHDSPCLSICSHKQGDEVCKGCGMLREEKRRWKRLDKPDKTKIRKLAEARLAKVRLTEIPVKEL